MPAHCSSQLSSETTFDPGEAIDGPKAIALRLGVRAQMSLVHAMSALQNSALPCGGDGALWWLDDAQAQIEAMRNALAEQRSAA